MDKETTTYEISYLLNSDLTDEGVTAFIEKIHNFITDSKGLILSEGSAKKINLAYAIKKETMALFNWIRFSLEPGAIKDIKNKLEKEEAVIRFLIIKPEKEPSGKKLFGKTKPKNKKIIIKESAKEPATEEKPTVKEEEIDKKIEEILGSD